MKKIILSVLIIGTSLASLAQGCVYLIPSFALLKNTDGSHIQSGDVLWICENVTFDIGGQNTNNVCFVLK